MTTQDKVQEAADLFRGKERYNCAQAVLKAFQKETGVSDLTIDAAVRSGSGSAPEGTCGALYAALILLGDALSDDARQAFQEQAGATTCRDIRTGRALNCRGCVKLAATMVAENLETLRAENPEYVSGLRAREAALLPRTA